MPHTTTCRRQYALAEEVVKHAVALTKSLQTVTYGHWPCPTVQVKVHTECGALLDRIASKDINHLLDGLIYAPSAWVRRHQLKDRQ